MVTAKFIIELECDGYSKAHELTREQAEALYAELGRALGKGIAMNNLRSAPLNLCVDMEQVRKMPSADLVDCDVNSASTPEGIQWGTTQ